MMDLLIELFSEEIPARMQPRAGEDLKRLITDGLVEAGLTYASAGAFSTPRRLALAVEGLTPESRPVREERKGPRTDAPEKAIEGFLRSTGLTLDQLERRPEKKGEVYFAVIEKPGRKAAEIVAEVLEATIRDFPWPKSMRWGSGSLRWVRPLHSIIAILSDEAGAQVVPLTVDGIAAGDTTHGHRFMAPDAFRVTGFDDYAAKLRRAKVMLDPAERESAIRQEAANLAFARGWEIVPDEGLMTELAGLVEWPVPLMGVIEARFLDLPPEVLQTSMKAHQKFLSARNPKTGRIEGYVTVANIETPDHGATILAGNQRVLAARLSDAAFFWENDLREALTGMQAWATGLGKVTFHAKLGSQALRVHHIADLARKIAPAIGADPDQAEQAARVAKLDLRSAMVGEFPELQGTMGRYYAQAAGLPQAVADAARDHYSPLGPSDEVPSAPVSVAVALADKLDTLAGFWAIDEKPTGSKDPFALRRAALGVIRLVTGNGLRLGLKAQLSTHLNERAFFGRRTLDLVFSLALNPLDFVEALEHSVPRSLQDMYLLHGVSDSLRHRISNAVEEAVTKGILFSKHTDILEVLGPLSIEERTAAEVFLGKLNIAEEECGEIPEEAEDSLAAFVAPLTADLLAFLHDRLKVHLRDQGIRHDVIDAVLAMPGSDDLTLVVRRATALNGMLGTEDGPNLLQGLKRAANILAQAEEKDGVEYSFGADPKFAETDEERALFAALDAAEPKIAAAMRAEDFPAAMSAIAALRAPIDAFFEAVQVNSDNPILRRNRLNLLSRIREAGRLIADFGRIEG
ncbi:MULTISPECIES: glycine--tRNA ligase subunit beta [unclassified Paracoccus (in: a-proteobacteria)]|uniref:glycine--tRNA ligase subunit beta n=1 Tax=unclassified Paracoccus (in: a-proteobacteria) TaxID=2688777 RepID=UPI0015FF5CD5|nr:MULTISPECIES: glycine--tRNA ligase subunit beta [unclassified Paracoccus (in: a-proteobacteria)]MBB1491205.1 glycine--tRNA ligase subunit beta [Paracoccus sp. MC1854]MBB1496981.1 glycine--tRNA ligase subunit beta [Paracoccus sp. MC1862]QQO46508.1 glycine--tRNA ligase subunit beta [Paracoccus sp. MC1862]